MRSSSSLGIVVFVLLPSVAHSWMMSSGSSTARSFLLSKPGGGRAMISRTRRRPLLMFATVSNSTSDQKQQQHQQQQHAGGSIASSSGLGRVLEGGQVIDFGAVRASEEAETALQRAKSLYQQASSLSSTTAAKSFPNGHQPPQQQNHDPHHVLAATTAGLQHTTTAAVLPPPPLRILGINDAVVKEVGHELGTFADAAAVQSCAAYLRSRAPAGMFVVVPPPNGSSPADTTVDSSLSSSSSSMRSVVTTTPAARQLLDQAYIESGEVTAAFAKTFYMGTMLLGEEARKSIWAIYVWCRRTDEIVDAPRGDAGNNNSQEDNNNNNNADLLLKDLSEWEVRLENLFQHGTVVDVYDLCLLDVRIRYPTLDIQPFKDMIRGMLMDVPGLGQERYETFDELHLYCYRVAGTVGVMSLPIFGCAAGFDDVTAREPALSLGVAFQLTNILRDVGEDAVQRGRVYLPQEDLRRFGVTEAQIFEQRLDENYTNLMKFQIERARMYYARARRGVFMLAPESRLPVQASLDAYGGILDKIEENQYDSLTKRAYVDKWEKLSVIPFSWYRTLDVSRSFPLPGDAPVTDIPTLRGV